MRALTKKVLKDITRRKLRTTFTILGIAIGVFGLAAIGISSSEFKSSFDYSTNLTSQQDMDIYTAPTSPDLASTLLQQPNVKAVQAQGNIVTRWSIGDQHVPIKIVGVLDFQHVQMNVFQLIEGSLPGPNQILLESSDRALQNVQIGDKIEVQTGQVFRALTVSGFARTQGLPSAGLENRGQGYMSESAFEQFFQRTGVTDFQIQLHDYAQLNQTAQQLSAVVAAHHIEIAGVSVGRDTSVNQLADGVFATMNVLSLIAILLSALLLLSTITALITEQVQHIGTMKALGAGRGQVMRHYLALVIWYSLLGTLVGLVLGILGGYELARYLGALVSLDIEGLQISPLLLLECIGIGIGVPLLAALLPVYFGTRITVHQALSGYGIENTARRPSLPARILARGLPQTVQFGTRNLFRKRMRAVLTLLILTAAGASFLAVSTASYSFNAFLNQVFDTYHFNVTVSLSDPIPVNSFHSYLDSVQGVASLEELNQDQVSTKWGTALLSGIRPDTHIYQHTMLAGRWFTATDRNVVILSKDAADKSGLTVGQTITLDTPQANATWQIIGIISDYSGIGPGNLGTLVAPIDQVTAFLQMPAGTAAQVMIQSSDTSQDAVDNLASRVDNALSAHGLLPDVTTAQEQIQQDQDKYQIIYALLEAVAIVIALVGMISLSNALAMSILERRREIGILRSIGAVGRKVAQVFWTEGMTLGVFSWLLAIVVGLPAAYAFVKVQAHFLVPVPFAFNPTSLLLMLILILVVAFLASIGPVIGAARVKIAQTLRYE